MKFIDISIEDYSNLRNELKEYVVIAKTHNYNPIKEDFTDIIKFILLYQGGGSTLCESYNNEDSTSQKMTNRLYESFKINEAEKDFDSAIGSVVTAGALAGGAAIGAGLYISYLFKRGKIKKSIEDEFKPEFDRIRNFETLNKLREELHKLRGEKGTPKASLPGNLRSKTDSAKDKLKNK